MTNKYDDLSLEGLAKELDLSIEETVEKLKSKGHSVEAEKETRISSSMAYEVFNFSATSEEPFFNEEIQKTSYPIGYTASMRVMEHFDNYSLIVNEENETYTFRGLDPTEFDIGKQIRLFVKEVKPNGEPVFEWHAPAYYKESETYPFQVRNKFVSKNNQSFFALEDDYGFKAVVMAFPYQVAPDYEMPGQLLCRVKKINENNTLWLEQVSQPDLDKVFISGRTYDFEFVELVEKESITLFKIRYNGLVAMVKAHDWQLSPEYTIPATIRCFVKNVQDNKVFLVQDYRWLIGTYFRIGEIYAFTVRNKNLDDSSSFEVLELEDALGNSNSCAIPLFYDSSALATGTKVMCRVRNIYPNGRLDLFLVDNDLIADFPSFEDVLKGTPYIDIESRFYFFEPLVKGLVHYNDPAKNLFHDYKAKENTWLFSFLTVLENYIKSLLQERKFEEALPWLDIYIHIENWILDSKFLEKFSPEKKEINLYKAAAKIKECEQKREAIDLIINHAANDYFQAFSKEINKKSVDNLEYKMGVLEQLVRLEPENDSISAYDMAEMIFKIRSQDKNFLEKISAELLRLVELQHNKIRTELQEKGYSDTQRIKEGVCYAAMESLIHQELGNLKRANISLSQFLRHASALAIGEEKSLLLHASISFLTGFESDTVQEIISWDMLKNPEKEFSKIKSPKGKKTLSSLKVGEEVEATIISVKNGYLALCEKQLIIVPDRHSPKALLNGEVVNLHLLHQFFQAPLFIGSMLKDLDAESYPQNASLGEIIDFWWPIHFYGTDEKQRENVEIDIDKEYRCVAKDAYIAEKQGQFFTISDNNIDGVLHLMECTFFPISDISRIFKPGDVVKLRARNVIYGHRGMPEKLSFNVKDILWEHVGEVFQAGDETYALVKKKYDSLALLVTEYGYKAAFKIEEGATLQEGEVYKVKVLGFNDEKQAIEVDLLKTISRNFYLEKEYKKVLERFIIQQPTLPDFMHWNPNTRLNGFQVIFDLMSTLEMLCKAETNLANRNEVLNWAKLVGVFCKVKNSYLYDAYIKYIWLMDCFEQQKLLPQSSDIALTIETLDTFPKLNQLQDIIDLMDAYGEASKLGQEKLLRVATLEKAKSEVQSLAKLVLSLRLLEEEKEVDEIYANLLKLISEKLRSVLDETMSSGNLHEFQA